MSWLRRALVCLLAPLALMPVGCLFRRDDTTANWLKQLAGPSGSDVIVMDVAILEVPVGDRYVNGELWSAVDDQVLPAETRKRLSENGLRVAKVCGRPPDRLFDLLTSDRSNRNARQVRRRANDPYSLPIGPSHESCRFQLAGEPEWSSFEQASCLLQVTPVLTKDGKIQVQFLPQVQHADKKRGMFSPTIALALQTQRPTESFSSLRWEAPLGLNEYLIIGAYFDKAQALGFQFFVDADKDRPLQRLLAIRAGRMGQVTDSAAPLVGDASRSLAPAAHAGAPLAIP